MPQHPSLRECGQDSLPSFRVLGSPSHILELGLFPLPPSSCLTREMSRNHLLSHLSSEKARKVKKIYSTFIRASVMMISAHTFSFPPKHAHITSTPTVTHHTTPYHLYNLYSPPSPTTAQHTTPYT